MRLPDLIKINAIKFPFNAMMRTTLVLTLLATAACQGGADSLFPKAERPIPEFLIKAMKAKGMTTKSALLIRIFKEESALEVWKKKNTGRYELLQTYEICKWSGKLGPKFKEGDRQAPEGFYMVAPGQMNPKSLYHLSFNMGYPNQFDRTHGRTGTHLMVHGACSSAGCYSMTDEVVEEIYALAREAFKGGQRKFQIQAYPFRMTPQNMVSHRDSKHYEFWKTLKKGNDYFEVAKYPPKVDVCEQNYIFNREVEKGVRFKSNAACPVSTIPPLLEQAYLKKHQSDAAEMAEITGKLEKKNQLNNLLAGKKDQVSSDDLVTAGNRSGDVVASDASTGNLPPKPVGEIPLARPVGATGQLKP